MNLMSSEFDDVIYNGKRLNNDWKIPQFYKYTLPKQNFNTDSISGRYN